MDRGDHNLMIALVVGITVSVVRWTLVPDARWWNLVIAAALRMVLALYLRHERRSP